MPEWYLNTNKKELHYRLVPNKDMKMLKNFRIPTKEEHFTNACSCRNCM